MSHDKWQNVGLIAAKELTQKTKNSPINIYALSLYCECHVRL